MALREAARTFLHSRNSATSVMYNSMLNGQPVITGFIGNRSQRGFIGLHNHLPKRDVVF
jgi:hypothetical protein